jgi:hypothetical protein
MYFSYNFGYLMGKKVKRVGLGLRMGSTNCVSASRGLKESGGTEMDPERPFLTGEP